MLQTCAIAQEKQPLFDAFSIGGKGGGYSEGFNPNKSNGGFALGFDMDVFRKRMMYSIDYTLNDEFNLFGDAPSEKYENIGVLAGSYIGNKYIRLEYQAGAGIIWGRYRTDTIIDKNEGPYIGWDIYESKDFWNVSGVGKVSFKIIPIRYIAVGVELQGNLNPVTTFYNQLITVEIGNLRID
ncbi:hypothetical protein [Algivirga pacifica]|uniref:Outer membrane protein beta-barrel domain-containing protein n=1 Tax=Algivirga pacifica TaxID=1162670 RepID=A0ABP9D238_9BACT